MMKIQGKAFDFVSASLNADRKMLTWSALESSLKFLPLRICLAYCITLLFMYIYVLLCFLQIQLSSEKEKER